MIRSLCLLVLACVVGGLHAAPIPKSIKKLRNDWIPFAVGNKWEYVQSGEDTETIVEIREVTAMDVKDKVTLATQKTTNVMQNYRIDEEGVAVVGSGGATYKEPRYIVKPNMKEGDTWSWDAGGYVENRVVGKAETIKVPAGEFTAVPISFEYVQNGTAFQKGTVWYSPGTGLVRIDYEGYSHNLKAFTTTETRK